MIIATRMIVSAVNSIMVRMLVGRYVIALMCRSIREHTSVNASVVEELEEAIVSRYN